MSRSRAVLRNSSFRLLVLGQGLSALGDSIGAIALIFGILHATHSAVLAGLVLASASAPILPLTLIGGVWGDRISRSRIMLGSDVVRLIAQAITAVTLAMPHPSVWILLSAQALYGTASAFFNPAAASLIPLLVRPDDISPANSVFSTVSNLARTFGPALAGICIVSVGYTNTLLLDAASFGISALTLALIKAPHMTLQTAAPFYKDLAEGFTEFRRQRWFSTTVLYFTILIVIVNAPIAVIGPLVSQMRLGGAVTWSIVVTLFGVGTGLGSLAAARRTRYNTLVTCYLAMLLNIPVLLLLALSTSRVALGISMLVAGLGAGFAMVVWRTLVQQRVPSEKLSRLLSYETIGTVALYPLGLAVIAPVAQRVGIVQLLLAGSLILTAATLLCIAQREIRSV
jgi:predicted MFS family arabinose efflux permease